MHSQNMIKNFYLGYKKNQIIITVANKIISYKLNKIVTNLLD